MINLILNTPFYKEKQVFNNTKIGYSMPSFPKQYNYAV
jgi:hypothetical protein